MTLGASAQVSASQIPPLLAFCKNTSAMSKFLIAVTALPFAGSSLSFALKKNQNQNYQIYLINIINEKYIWVGLQ